MRIALIPAVVVALGNVVAACGGQVTSPPTLRVKEGEPCDVRNAKTIGITGCDFCVCVQGQWSCNGGDCACQGAEGLIVGDGCTTCPCVDGKFQCTYTPCNACPPGRTDLSCELGATWARDEASGVCCEYAKPCAANAGWQTFASEAECNPLACSCDRTAGAPPQPVGCGCPPGGCATLSDTLLQGCPFELPVLERRGCGKVELSFSGGTVAGAAIFDELSETMIGIASGLDQQFGVCHIFGYTFGAEFDCMNVQNECTHCGSLIERPDVPRCAGR